MRPERWKIVERLLEQIEGTTGRLVMAVAPEPIDVVLYETPVLAWNQPPQNPLRGFIQEAVSLLDQPTAADVAALLHLPETIVELVLGNLQQMGGAISDVVGRWSVPDSAPKFGTDRNDSPIWRRTRRLLCYWPKQQVLLPVLPRMRLRDLVELGVHHLQGEVADWYSEIVSWSGIQSSKRGLPESVRMLPLKCLPNSLASESPEARILADESISKEEILVSRFRLDVISLTWSSFSSGIWEVVSRLWSRPTPYKDADGEPFAPGEPILGLSLPEQLLGGGTTLDNLGSLFNPNPEAWRKLVNYRDDLSRIRRALDGEYPALLVEDTPQSSENRRWQGLRTRIADEARLLCYILPASSEASR